MTPSPPNTTIPFPQPLSLEDDQSSSSAASSDSRPMAATTLSPSSAPRDFRDPRDIPSFSSKISSTHKPAPLHRSPSGNSITSTSRRQSLVESLRGVPNSGHRSRQPSLTPAAVQELLNNPPPPGKNANPKFAGREWRDITVSELVSLDDIVWISMDDSVEEATKLLVKSPTNVVLIRENSNSKTAISTFDFNDLNAYLLVVVGLARPDDDQLSLFNEIIAKVQTGASISLREIQPICRKETLVNLPSNANLAQAIEVLGSGIHRILVAGREGGNVIGILSQLRVLDFFWNERVNFPAVDRLYPAVIRDLGIGTQQIIAVNSDSPLADALTLMNDEGLTSVAVVDNGQNVVGNISAKDVRHLTSTASAPLLRQSCMHFISVILNERGMELGQDAVPVFYVNPFSTLAHTVAKLVATRSHRMWVVESASPSPTAPGTPLLGPQTYASDRGAHHTLTSPLPTPTSPVQVPLSPVPLSPVPASAMAGARISGKLSGVISLTDILNVFAKMTGLHPSDPGEQRARRRRSSSGSVPPSIDSRK